MGDNKISSSKLRVDEATAVAVTHLHYLNERIIANFTDTNALDRLEQAKNESKSKSKGDSK